MVTWAAKEGCPAPLGATWIAGEDAYNFALYSRAASRVTLLLYTLDDLVRPSLSYQFDPLRNKTGPVWHTRISNRQMSAARYYDYSIDGPPSPDG